MRRPDQSSSVHTAGRSLPAGKPFEGECHDSHPRARRTRPSSADDPRETALLQGTRSPLARRRGAHGRSGKLTADDDQEGDRLGHSRPPARRGRRLRSLCCLGVARPGAARARRGRALSSLAVSAAAVVMRDLGASISRRPFRALLPRMTPPPDAPKVVSWQTNLRFWNGSQLDRPGSLIVRSAADASRTSSTRQFGGPMNLAFWGAPGSRRASRSSLRGTGERFAFGRRKHGREDWLQRGACRASWRKAMARRISLTPAR